MASEYQRPGWVRWMGLGLGLLLLFLVGLPLLLCIGGADWVVDAIDQPVED